MCCTCIQTKRRKRESMKKRNRRKGAFIYTLPRVYMLVVFALGVFPIETSPNSTIVSGEPALFHICIETKCFFSYTSTCPFSLPPTFLLIVSSSRPPSRVLLHIHGHIPRWQALLTMLRIQPIIQQQLLPILHICRRQQHHRLHQR